MLNSCHIRCDCLRMGRILEYVIVHSSKVVFSVGLIVTLMTENVGCSHANASVRVTSYYVEQKCNTLDS